MLLQLDTVLFLLNWFQKSPEETTVSDVKSSVADPESFSQIPDLDFPSPDPLTQKIYTELSEILSAMFIPDLDFSHPDPDVKKVLDPGSGLATLVKSKVST
jgi:hypothetical protein